MTEKEKGILDKYVRSDINKLIEKYDFDSVFFIANKQVDNGDVHFGHIQGRSRDLIYLLSKFMENNKDLERMIREAALDFMRRTGTDIKEMGTELNEISFELGDRLKKRSAIQEELESLKEELDSKAITEKRQREIKGRVLEIAKQVLNP